jgi:hypothetical protein
MVQRGVGKLIDVGHGQPSLFELLEESVGDFFFAPAGYRKDHSPVAALKKTPPWPAGLGFQQRPMHSAKLVQISKTGNLDSPFFGSGAATIPTEDRFDQMFVIVRANRGKVRSKAGVIKEFPRGPGHWKTVQRVLWRRLRFPRQHLAGIVEFIMPFQFIGICETVLSQMKLFSTRTRASAPAGEQSQNREPKQPGPTRPHRNGTMT